MPGELAQFTGFTSTKGQTLTPEARSAVPGVGRFLKFTCSTSTKVQTLTPEALRARRARSVYWRY